MSDFSRLLRANLLDKRKEIKEFLECPMGGNVRGFGVWDKAFETGYAKCIDDILSGVYDDSVE